MNKETLGILGTIPLVTAGILFNPISATAADIGATASGIDKNIYGISSLAGSSNGVIVKISGNTASFDFVNPVARDFGRFEVDYATDAFSDFGGSRGLIKDISGLAFPIAPDTKISLDIPEFLALDNAFSPGSLSGAPSSATANDFFDLKSVFSPTFVSIGTGTVVSFGIEGVFRTADGRVLDGKGTLSATFVGLTQAQIITLASRPNGLRTPFSATFQAVPEPMTMLGVGTALGFGALFKRKQAKKDNKA